MGRDEGDEGGGHGGGGYWELRWGSGGRGGGGAYREWRWGRWGGGMVVVTVCRVNGLLG